MKNRGSFFTLGLAIGVLVLGIAFSVYLTTVEYGKDTVIVLPEKTDDTIVLDDTIRRENGRVTADVTLDKDNVKQLLTQIKRPEKYVFSSTTEVYNGNVKATNLAKGSVSGNTAKIIQYEGETPSVEVLLTSQYVYSWQSGSKNFYRTGKGNFDYDDMARLATYEDLMEREIESARFVTQDGQLHIQAVSMNGATGNLETYTISVYNGLLKSMTVEKDGAVVAKAEIVAVTVNGVEENTFELPNGLVPTE